jgi:hypothetical protein
MLPLISRSDACLALAAGFLFAIIASSAHAIPFTTNDRSQRLAQSSWNPFWRSSEESLERVLRNSTDYVGSGSSGYYTQADQTANALFTAADGTKVTALVIDEQAGYSNDNQLGLYNLDGLEIILFDGSAGAGALGDILFVGDTLKIGSTEYAGFGNTFGLFLRNDVEGFTWYSQDILNPGGGANFLGFEQGDSLYFGFEDLDLGCGDYNDLVVKMTWSKPGSPVPEPTAALVFGLGALVVGVTTRRRNG